MQNLVHASDFFSDLKSGSLPTFSYYNVECCTMTSMHPSSNIAGGESMIKNIYDSLRASEYWEDTCVFSNLHQ
jgi:phospholipase C